MFVFSLFHLLNIMTSCGYLLSWHALAPFCFHQLFTCYNLQTRTNLTFFNIMYSCKVITAFSYCFCPADGCRHWERHSAAMEAQAQWAGKLLQEYQKRAEACGFPGPHTEVPQPANDSPAKILQGTTVELMWRFVIPGMHRSLTAVTNACMRVVTA